MKRYFLATLLALLPLVPSVASAQVPSYAQPAAAVSDDEQIRGRVVAFDGAYSLTVRDERGFIDHIQLHPGTIINPTGLTLAPGMVVSILGFNAGAYLDANEIDTPYTYYGGVPYYYGHPWNYWGPSVSFGFFFGNTGWWHGSYFHGGYHYYGGARIYNSVQVRGVYNVHAGQFSGRQFVAPREHGGYYAGHAGGSRGYESHGEGGHGDGGHDHR